MAWLTLVFPRFTPRRYMFSRACHRVNGFASRFDWFLMIVAFVLIGCDFALVLWQFFTTSLIQDVNLRILQDATGRWTMEEIPNSEKVFKADLVIIAAGFLGPEKTLAEQFGIKKASLRCL